MEVHVPHNPLPREVIKAFFEKNSIKNQTVLINVEASHMMGMSRLMTKQYMVDNIYKGKEEPVDELTKLNPMLAIDE